MDPGRVSGHIEGVKVAVRLWFPRVIGVEARFGTIMDLLGSISSANHHVLRVWAKPSLERDVCRVS